MPDNHSTRNSQDPVTDWFLVETVQQQFSLACQYSAQRAAQELVDRFTWRHYVNKRVESPIEMAFVVWWAAIEQFERQADDPGNYTIGLQTEVEACGNKYRLDFTLGPCHHHTCQFATARKVPFPKIAIELDGHDFHERTKQQVARRDKRDRDLQRDGWTVFHFSGSEFLRDPVRCIREIREGADLIFSKFIDAIFAAGSDSEDSDA